MIILRIIFGIIALPFMLLAYLLHYFFRLAVILSTKLIIIIAGLAIIGGILVLLVESCAEPQYPGDKGNNAAGIWMIVGGVAGCFLPYIGAFLSDFFRFAAEWIKVKAYH